MHYNIELTELVISDNVCRLSHNWKYFDRHRQQSFWSARLYLWFYKIPEFFIVSKTRKFQPDWLKKECMYLMPRLHYYHLRTYMEVLLCRNIHVYRLNHFDNFKNTVLIRPNLSIFQLNLVFTYGVCSGVTPSLLEQS